MNKNSALSVLCTVLISILCNGTETESNLSSHDGGILPGGSINEKQQEMHECPEMQEMREKLTWYRTEIVEHKEVLKKLYKKVRFWLGYPISLILAGRVFLLTVEAYKEPKVAAATGVAIAIGGLTFATSHFIISHILSAIKAGWIFSKWNRKKQMEEYLVEDKKAIESLGDRLSKEELNLLLQEEKNKGVRRLLFAIVRTK